MRVLVIGGNGFIGSRLMLALRDRGDSVIVVDRFPARTDVDWHEVRYLQADFHDHDVLDEVLPGVQQVYHSASCTVPSTADADPVLDIQGNLLGTHALLAAMRRHGVRRICYFSSGGTVYGNPQAIPVAESHPLAPISSYGIVKVAVERYLGMFQRQGWLDPVVVRPSNPYGPGQAVDGAQGAVAVFLGRALTGQGVQVWGDGETVRDYIFIDDLIRLTLLAAGSACGAAFNAGSGVGTSLNDLCDRVRRGTGQALVAEDREGRAFDVRAIVLDVSRAWRELGWAPKVDIDTGIQLTWQALITT